MKITRINHDKKLNTEVELVDVEVNGQSFRLTEEFGNLVVMNKRGNPLNVHPKYGNVIELIITKTNE